MAVRAAVTKVARTPESFAAEVRRRATAKLSSSAVRSEIFRIGPIRFRLSGAGERWLGGSLFPDPDASFSGSCDGHTAICWDGSDPASLPPKPPWGPLAYAPLGVITACSNENVRCAYDIHTGSLLVYDLAANASYTWYPDIAALPAWATASPFRVVLSWLCNRHGIQLVHGGSVALNGHAALLAGPGGAGKSTTALACALAGLGYLGDDYCAVEPATGTIHMVYRSAKLFESSLKMLPSLTDKVINADRIAQEKGVLYLDPDEANLVASAKLSAILLPCVGTGARTNVRPATRAEAIKAILPSTVYGFMGGTTVTPKMILELAQSVPAFHLELGTDVGSVVDTVATSLQRYSA